MKLSDAYHSPMQVASVKPNTVCMDKEKSDSSTLQKKTIRYTVGLAVRIFPATMRTFIEGHNTVGAGQGRSMACVN